MDREIIKLNNSQWENVVYEQYLENEFGQEVPIKKIRVEHNGPGRHTECYSLIFQRELDGKYFKVDYEESVKDSMGWAECNYCETEAIEVFPTEKVIIEYK